MQPKPKWMPGQTRDSRPKDEVIENKPWGESLAVVKIRFRMVPKSYKNGRIVYSHEEVTLNFPKKVHELLRFLGGRQILIRGYREGKKVHLEIWAKDDP